MAFRSFSITINNYYLKPWTRSGLGLSHGVWAGGNSQVPPDQLPPFHIDEAQGAAVPGTISFQAESQGVLTGVEGFVNYTHEDKGPMHVFFDNPTAGGNQFNASGPAGVGLFWGDPGGNDAHINLDIRPV